MLRAASSAPEPCAAATVVFDFDGTLTDAEAHAPAFLDASRRELARRLGWDEPTARREWRRAHDAVSARPAATAWIVDGHGVCPLLADPYLLANGVVRSLLTTHRPDLPAATLAAWGSEIHAAAYAGTPPPLQPDAHDVLDELCRAGIHVRIVTNSEPRIVMRGLGALPRAAREGVVARGGAGKFTIGPDARADARFAALPDSVAWPGVGRPVLLRRGRYFDVLRDIWDETGTGPETTLAVGDILELDLAMPAALGAHVHLLTRASTLPHERALATRLARGDASPRLGGVLERLGRGRAGRHA